MAQTIEQWLERVTRQVDEDGAHTRRILLAAADGGMTWETWEGPFGESSDGIPIASLATEIEDVANSLAEEWPKRRHQILLIAQDKDGSERSRFPKSIMGKAANATNAVMGGQHAALDSIMNSFAETMKNLLGQANSQLNVQGRRIEQDSEHITQLIDVIRAHKEQEIINMQETGTQDAMQKLLEAAAEQGPGLLELLIASKTKTPAAKTGLEGAAGAVAKALDKG